MFIHACADGLTGHTLKPSVVQTSQAPDFRPLCFPVIFFKMKNILVILFLPLVHCTVTSNNPDLFKTTVSYFFL